MARIIILNQDELIQVVFRNFIRAGIAKEDEYELVKNGLLQLDPCELVPILLGSFRMANDTSAIPVVDFPILTEKDISPN